MADPASAREQAAAVLAAHVVDVPDFPRPGVLFKDLNPLFADGPAFRTVIDAVVDTHRGEFDVVAGIEARGFVLGAAVAYASEAGLVPIRKAGKLPRQTYAVSYALEYGTATLELQHDALRPGARVLLVDDVLATGGTAAAAAELIERAGAMVVGVAVLLELTALAGRDRLGRVELDVLLSG